MINSLVLYDVMKLYRREMVIKELFSDASDYFNKTVLPCWEIICLLVKNNRYDCHVLSHIHGNFGSKSGIYFD
jgi:hypothetical protein